MKIRIYGYDLAEAVGKVAKAVDTKAVNPILEGIRIATDGEYAVVTATDLDIGVETRVKCEVVESGATVVVGKAFIEYASKLTALDYVEITADGKQLKAVCGKVKFALATMDEKQFPKINKDLDGDSFTIAVADLKKAVGETAFCCATDEARPILKGCLFEIVGETLNVCALDGFRLALNTCEVYEADGTVKVVIPARSLTELIRLVGDKERVEIVVQGGTLAIKTDNTIFTARLLNGDFVNYNALLGQPTATEVCVGVDELATALDRLSILAKVDKNNVVRCVVDNGVMQLTANSDLGNGEETIEVDYADKKVDLHFNFRYISDCLKAIQDEKIRLCFGKDERSPFFIFPEQNGDYKYLILPVRVNRA
jgi:DNA polymerase-3 subunit beta